MVQNRIPQNIVDEFVGAAHGDFAKVEKLLAEHPGLLNADATWHETALAAAAQMGRKDIAEHLLAAGAPLDICTAAMLGLAEQVKEFLQADRTQANAAGAHGIPVLYHAVIRGRKEVAELLLAHGAEVNAGEGGATALHGAVMFNQPEMAEWLLARGANVGAKDYEGKTALARAIESGSAAMAELLRRRGAAE